MAAAILALPDGSGLDWLHAVSANPPAMPAAMNPRLVSRVLSKGPPFVGSTDIDRSSAPVDSPSAPYTVLGCYAERKYRYGR